MYRPTLHCSLVVVKSLTQAAQTTEGLVAFIWTPSSDSLPLLWRGVSEYRHTSSKRGARFPGHRLSNIQGPVLCKRSTYHYLLQPKEASIFPRKAIVDVVLNIKHRYLDTTIETSSQLLNTDSHVAHLPIDDTLDLPFRFPFVNLRPYRGLQMRQYSKFLFLSQLQLRPPFSPKL